MANQPQSIAAWYNSCMPIFEKISEILADPEHGISGNDKTLSLVQDQIGRFRVWAGNMGAHRVGRMSLDYKLREASHIYNAVVELLEELNGSLTEMLATAQKNPLETIVETKEGEDEEKETSGGEEEIDISDSESTTSGSEADLDFMLDDIANIISCLYNLSVAMRQPVPRDRLQKYADIDLTHYEFFDNQHVLEKFPLTKPFLIQRLGNANTQRRQYFKYRLLHHEKIANDLHGPLEPVLGGRDSQQLNKDAPNQGVGVTQLIAESADPAKGKSKSNPTNQDTATIITAARTSTTVSTVLKSTKLPTQSALDNIEIESDAGRTATSFGTTMETATVKELKVPDPPNADHVFDGNAFECPYCYSLVIVKNKKTWWRHVFRDLRPYVCTFESCTKPNRLFENRHDWYDHEVRDHRREWHCAECNLAFSTIPNFTCHLKEIHPALLVDKQELSAMISNCERALNTPQPCPLCESKHTPHQLRRHLAGHMRQLALFTLPRLETEESESEDAPSMAGMKAREADSSDEEDNERMTELEFDSNPSQGSRWEEREEVRDRGGTEEVTHGLSLQHGAENEGGQRGDRQESDNPSNRKSFSRPRRRSTQFPPPEEILKRLNQNPGAN